MSLPAIDRFAQATTQLAIVIPAYKPHFFREALGSLERQTDKSFIVYVGDDASPYDLASICEPFKATMELRYHRFAANMGQSNLVGHWTRCLSLSSEPWVWLFSDDDVMEDGCVKAVLDRIRKDAGAIDIYHFDVLEIDVQGYVVREAKGFPDHLSSYAFALARTSLTISSYAPDYVFSRAAWLRAGGFEKFPLAWCSDDATWIKIALRAGIHTIRGQKIRWRMSGVNISSASKHSAVEKLVAASQYVGWFSRFLRENPPPVGEPSAAMLRESSLRWLVRHSQYLGARFWPHVGLHCGWYLRSAFLIGPIGGWLATMYWDLRYRVRGW